MKKSCENCKHREFVCRFYDFDLCCDIGGNGNADCKTRNGKGNDSWELHEEYKKEKK